MLRRPYRLVIPDRSLWLNEQFRLFGRITNIQQVQESMDLKQRSINLPECTPPFLKRYSKILQLGLLQKLQKITKKEKALHHMSNYQTAFKPLSILSSRNLPGTI